MSAESKSRRTLWRWLKSTSRRTFVLYPVCIIAIELVVRGGDLVFVPWGLPFLVWGYLQYRLGGQYRTRMGGGGPGLSNPPERIVDSGIYAYTRNPMYLGHLIFMAGLAITFWSLAALALLMVHLPWYQRRVRGDEAHLTAMFGQEFIDYTTRVKRWIPGVL
jgi:protein-S-isoprenylcysteine O-methyltransferase Ste14